MSALHWAAHKNATETAALLINKGVDVHSKDSVSILADLSTHTNKYNYMNNYLLFNYY